MTEIRTRRKITFQTTTEWPTDYPGITLAEAVAYEKNQPLEEVMDLLLMDEGDVNLNTAVEFSEVKG